MTVVWIEQEAISSSILHLPASDCSFTAN